MRTTVSGLVPDDAAVTASTMVPVIARRAAHPENRTAAPAEEPYDSGSFRRHWAMVPSNVDGPPPNRRVIVRPSHVNIPTLA